jgi:hypothetical protein
VSLPGIGETQVRKNVTYDELKKLDMEFVIKKITPIVEAKVLKKLVFVVEYPRVPMAVNPKGQNPPKKRVATLNCDRKGDVDEIIKHLKFVGSTITARRKVKITAYTDQTTFYIHSGNAVTHFMLKLSREIYDRLLEWAKTQKLPMSYVDFESKAIVAGFCSKSHIWNFSVIAAIKKDLVTTWDSRNHHSIINRWPEEG